MSASSSPIPATVLLPRLAAELDLDVRALAAASQGHTRVPLASTLATSELAWASVLVAGATLGAGVAAAPDPLRIAASYQSDRHLLIDGAQPEVWSPLSRFWPVVDGWVRTHGNYPHHAAALRSGLSLSSRSAPEDVSVALSRLTADQAADRITAAGGVCVTVRPEQPHVDAALRQHPLIELARLGEAPARPLHTGSALPLHGIRVLDLTRVIAGPVATRTLAFAGAEVLRIDPPDRDEFAWQHLDTGQGKRSALLDLEREPARLHALLTEADVIVLGYRPDGLRRLGLTPQSLAAQHPHLVIAQLSAWPGDHSPRGFDSIVQADAGISWIESPDGVTPGALPAQALDHSAGYLLAAGVVAALRRRASAGGIWYVRTSLRRVAAELLGMPRGRRAELPPYRAATQTCAVGDAAVTMALPAVTWPGAPDVFAAPRRWGGDQPEWSAPAR